MRRHGRGGLGPLTAAMVRDPALILWLDGQRNNLAAPNENLARELMELFTLGIGHYTEDDVRAGARALTGWTVDRRAGAARFVARRHDPGEKTILGRAAAFNAKSYALLLAGEPRSATFLWSRLWLRFAGTEPVPGRPANSPATALRMLRAIFTEPAFERSRGQLVKQPVEWAVGAMRQLGIRPSGLTEQQRRQVRRGLSGMNQVPLQPPSVGGWPSGEGWLNTSSLQARMRLADLFARTAGPVTVRRLAAAPGTGRVDALARILVVDGWTDRTRNALAPLTADPERLIAAGLISPEYTVS